MSGSVSMIDGHVDPDTSRITEAESFKIESYLIDREKPNYKLSEKIMEAVEKQIPKRAIMKGFRPCEEICSVSYLCPVCKKHINIDKYCYHCGQALDWSDTE